MFVDDLLLVLQKKLVSLQVCVLECERKTHVIYNVGLICLFDWTETLPFLKPLLVAAPLMRAWTVFLTMEVVKPVFTLPERLVHPRLVAEEQLLLYHC